MFIFISDSWLFIGCLIWAPLGLYKATGRPKGFCLFVYKSAESAKRALEEPHKNVNVDGHILHFQKAIDSPRPVKSQHHNQLHHSRNMNSGFGGGAPAGRAI